MMERIKESLDKKAVEKQLKEAQEKMAIIKAQEEKDLEIERAKSRKRKREEDTYRFNCMLYKIHLPASQRYEAYLRFIFENKELSGKPLTYNRDQLVKIRSNFRVTRLCAFLDSLDVKEQTEVQYSKD